MTYSGCAAPLNAVLKHACAPQEIYLWTKQTMNVAQRGRSGHGDGVHVLTGPIYICGAAPGDVLQARALRPLAVRMHSQPCASAACVPACKEHNITAAACGSEIAFAAGVGCSYSRDCIREREQQNIDQPCMSSHPCLSATYVPVRWQRKASKPLHKDRSSRVWCLHPSAFAVVKGLLRACAGGYPEPRAAHQPPHGQDLRHQCGRLLVRCFGVQNMHRMAF